MSGTLDTRDYMSWSSSLQRTLNSCILSISRPLQESDTHLLGISSTTPPRWTSKTWRHKLHSLYKMPCVIALPMGWPQLIPPGWVHGLLAPCRLPMSLSQLLSLNSTIVLAGTHSCWAALVLSGRQHPMLPLDALTLDTPSWSKCGG